MSANSSSIYLGIDTGGTFTDGVLFDPQTRRVVKSAKVLTTHHDLKMCVSRVLDQPIPEDPTLISFLSLSTTLATNAIAEGKRKRSGREWSIFPLGPSVNPVWMEKQVQIRKE